MKTIHIIIAVLMLSIYANSFAFTIAGDLDSDDDVDGSDFHAFIDAYSSNSPEADINNDDVINVEDIAVLAQESGQIFPTNIYGLYNIASDLWVKAVLQAPDSPVTLVWKMVSWAITPSGDHVISGYFHADPNDYSQGSQYNPKVFVKVYMATSGWCNIAFNHVTDYDVTVYSANNSNGLSEQAGTITLYSPLEEHQYTGVLIDATPQPPDIEPGITSDTGYTLISPLWANAILQTPIGDVTLTWLEVGTDTTPKGDTVVSGYFYADPDEFLYGSLQNPEVFVKVYIDPDGSAKIFFNHVTVDDVSVFSAHNYSGMPDQSGTVSLSNRLVVHQYDGVSLQ